MSRWLALAERAAEKIQTPPDTMTKPDKTPSTQPEDAFCQVLSNFQAGDALWQACVSYFDWATSHPFKEDRVFSYKGEQTHESVSLLRAFTLSGLCLHLGVTEETWRAWRKDRPDLKEVITKAESVVHQQKFEGGAAGLLNANIIARDLGLADKKDHQSTDGSI